MRWIVVRWILVRWILVRWILVRCHVIVLLLQLENVTKWGHTYKCRYRLDQSVTSFKWRQRYHEYYEHYIIYFSLTTKNRYPQYSAQQLLSVRRYARYLTQLMRLSPKIQSQATVGVRACVCVILEYYYSTPTCAILPSYNTIYHLIDLFATTNNVCTIFQWHKLR